MTHVIICLSLSVTYCTVDVVTDDTSLISRCPFVQKTMYSESDDEEAMDLTFTAQAVLHGISLCVAFLLREHRHC